MKKQQSKDEIDVKVGRKIIENIRDDSKIDGIQECIEKFSNCVDAFMEIVDKSSELQNSKVSVFYMRDLQHCINTIRSAYDVPERKMVRIDFSKLNLNVWGNIYWDFLHYSSILIQEAFYKGKITTLLNFPALVYNIDNILPCPVCSSHYRSIKFGVKIDNILQTMCFGFLVNGVFNFHSLVNTNIEKTEVFNDLDFALKYKCYTRTVTDHAINYGIIPGHVLFYQESHIRLSILLNILYNVDMFKLSNMIKRKSVTHSLRPEDFERERESTSATVTEDFNMLDNEMLRVIGYCHNNGYPPLEMDVWSFESLDNFKQVSEYWLTAINCRADKTYTIRFKDKQIVTIKNKTLQEELTKTKIN